MKLNSVRVPRHSFIERFITDGEAATHITVSSDPLVTGNEPFYKQPLWISPVAQRIAFIYLNFMCVMSQRSDIRIVPRCFVIIRCDL
jgi:hypothetical protein